MFARLFFRIVNRSAKSPQENKISREVRLLGCDLMWKIFVLPDYPVNSIRRTGKATARVRRQASRVPTICIPIRGWIGGHGARAPLPTIRARLLRRPHLDQELVDGAAQHAGLGVEFA